MSVKTQAQLEAQLNQRWTRVENDELSATEAFGAMDDWIIQLGERKAFLHPNLRQWMWYDRLHDEWVFAGCGVREGILLVVGKTGGLKKLPYEDDVANWCVYISDGQPYGPLQVDELRNKVKRGDTKSESQIWTPRSNDWLSLTDAQALLESRY